MPEADWYDDPDGSGDERYWDGESWTPRLRPKAHQSTGPIMLHCPNGHECHDHQKYCGQCGAPLVITVSGPPAGLVTGDGAVPEAPGLLSPSTRVLPRWGWIAAVGIAVVTMIAVVVFLAVRPGVDASDNLRWLGFPHTMACVQNRIEIPDKPADIYDLHLPDAARVTAITMAHLEAQQVKMSIHFLKAAPTAPREFISPINGEPMDEPGSLTYSVGLDTNNGEEVFMLSFESPTRAMPQWHFDPDKQHPDHPGPGVLLSANTTGNIVELVLDLNGMHHVLGNGPFRPGFDINASTLGPPDPTWPNGTQTSIDDQRCDWNNDDTNQSQEGGGTANSSPWSSMPSGRAASPASPGCGVNLGAAEIQAAINSVPTVPEGWPWSREPHSLQGNFNPCATLSTALITVQGGTRRSPEQALFFHDGSYVGTATANASVLVSLNRASTTDDTVVLDYKDPKSSAGDINATVISVRYQWQVDHVAMLDPAPRW